MNRLIALFCIVTVVTSAAAFAGQEEYDKCMQRCMKIAKTPEARAKCPKACEYFVDVDSD